jgi:hypothetical protein
LRSAASPAKAEATNVLFRSRAMLAILVIAIFIGVILTLNVAEFGRID